VVHVAAPEENQARFQLLFFGDECHNSPPSFDSFCAGSV
jgi:hypothetical protein